MPIRRPYYGLHQIIRGKYTPGNEYVFVDGTDYVGLYHVLPNGRVYTGDIPDNKSVELYEKRNDITDDVRKYNAMLGLKVSQYVSPQPFQPRPSNDEYSEGLMQRFFVQKRNNPYATITEIDGQQYNGINTSNNPGINGVVWNSVLLNWKISIVPTDDAAEFNRQQIFMAERKFSGISTYLTNPLEFYR